MHVSARPRVAASYTSVVDLIAIAVLAALILVKEAGVPVPIPGDLLVIGAGVATAGDPGSALVAIAAILVAGFVGGAIQFLLVRGALRRALIALLTRVGVSKSRIDSLADRLRRTGARGVALARVTPGVRVPAIAASGLAAVPLPAFIVGLVIGNSIFVCGHFALGFLVGAPATALLQSVGPTLLIGGLVVLAAIGAIGWLIVRRRGRSSRERFAAWADAACPACLALTLVGAESLSYTSEPSSFAAPD